MEFGVIYLVFLFYYLVNFYYRNKRLWHALMFFSMNCNMYSCVLDSTALCAHHSPCFPGNCSDTISCQCSDGFTGDTGLNRCKTCKLRFFNFALDIHVTLSEKIWNESLWHFAKGQRNFAMIHQKVVTLLQFACCKY